ncbi:DNA-binding XRE family transcriptional regulator [Paenibacillus sp. LBL]|uniref:helix-turn-helix domain-containing protein n=1 Tax=Paenibacillus sp. LBL TaxID=2940563 RepID=UPI002476631E|nr:helix-turn-helix transcriptional regulator [Paenibacillus sp. LBL]MDH6673188.1 DNA-binding XRE family transcriptional regulator [Paenibacillus sp. LBL]
MRNLKILGPRLAELRNKRGMTQAQLATKLKKSTSTIAMWETGNRDPDSDMIVKIAIVFDVSTDYLLGRTDDPDNGLKYSAGKSDKNWSENYHKIERFARKVSEQDLEKAVKILDAAFDRAFSEEHKEDDDDI